MPREYSRSQRVGDQLQRELALLIQQELKDPRVGMVTVTGVDVTRELERAVVYVTVLGDAAARETSLAGLRQAAGFLRRELGRRLRLRTVPELEFRYDSSGERGARVEALLREAARGRRED